MLGALGIGEFDERVYRAYLVQPDRTAREIAEDLGTTSSRVRHAVTRLVELGVLRREGHGRYGPVGPRTALSALLAQRRAEAEATFAAVRDVVDDLADAHRAGRLQGDPSGLVEVLTGEATVTRRVTELTQAIRTHFWVLDRPPYLWSTPNEAEQALTVDMLNRGIDLRSVYSASAFDRPGRFELVTRLARLGEQARFLPDLPFKLRIMDRRVAMLPLIPDRYDSIAIVHRSGLLDALIDLFHAYWDRAQPMVATIPEAAEQPSMEDLILLRMLQAGYKDQAIARQLGTSARTVTRRIATIAARLGVETRFQVGAEAARKGWI